jgi:hypothetical protein
VPAADRTFVRARWARGLCVAVGIGFAAAAAVSAAAPSSGLEATRSARWPLHAADAATLALFAFLAVLGAVRHPALLAEGSILLLAHFFANYDSESVVIPGIGAAAVVLAVAHFRCGSGILELGRGRIALLVMSTVAGVASLIAMQAEVGVVTWNRVRTTSGIETRVLRTTGSCAVYRDVPKDIDEIETGCEPIIPARRARYVIGYNAVSALLAVAAASSARTTRRPEG